MTLLEMSVQYAERAAAIRERITMLRGMERQESDLETARSLRRRVAELLPLWQEARDLARLTAHYYDREDLKQLSLEAKGGQWLADLASWERESAPDNREQLERLHRNLRLARQQALTDRQRQMLELYYDQGLTMGQIALKLNLNRSTVSRTLSRAKDKLYRCLRYSL